MAWDVLLGFWAPSLKERNLIAKLQRGAQTPGAFEPGLDGKVERSFRNFTFCDAIDATHNAGELYEMMRSGVGHLGPDLHRPRATPTTTAWVA
ncbi:hypothetical protein [Methylorubrum sp. SB2]|uniref:hypothetical protein n=1 Tax=Methylorubrum subtropicum TaxID=3138812 RepID=UPI00313B9CF4